MGIGSEGEPAPAPTFENNVFYQAYSFTNDRGFDVSGSISVQFNENMDSILTFSAESRIDHTTEGPHYNGIIEESMRGHEDVTPAVAFSPNGKYIASGSNDKKVFLWDLETRQVFAEFQGLSENTFPARLVNIYAS